MSALAWLFTCITFSDSSIESDLNFLKDRFRWNYQSLSVDADFEVVTVGGDIAQYHGGRVWQLPTISLTTADDRQKIIGRVLMNEGVELLSLSPTQSILEMIDKIRKSKPSSQYSLPAGPNEAMFDLEFRVARDANSVLALASRDLAKSEIGLEGGPFFWWEYRYPEPYLSKAFWKLGKSRRYQGVIHNVNVECIEFTGERVNGKFDARLWCALDPNRGYLPMAMQRKSHRKTGGGTDMFEYYLLSAKGEPGRGWFPTSWISMMYTEDVDRLGEEFLPLDSHKLGKLTHSRWIRHYHCGRVDSYSKSIRIGDPSPIGKIVTDGGEIKFKPLRSFDMKEVRALSLQAKPRKVGQLVSLADAKFSREEIDSIREKVVREQQKGDYVRYVIFSVISIFGAVVVGWYVKYRRSIVNVLIFVIIQATMSTGCNRSDGLSARSRHLATDGLASQTGLSAVLDPNLFLIDENYLRSDLKLVIHNPLPKEVKVLTVKPACGCSVLDRSNEFPMSISPNGEVALMVSVARPGTNGNDKLGWVAETDSGTFDMRTPLFVFRKHRLFPDQLTVRPKDSRDKQTFEIHRQSVGRDSDGALQLGNLVFSDGLSGVLTDEKRGKGPVDGFQFVEQIWKCELLVNSGTVGVGFIRVMGSMRGTEGKSLAEAKVKWEIPSKKVVIPSKFVLKTNDNQDRKGVLAAQDGASIVSVKETPSWAEVKVVDGNHFSVCLKKVNSPSERFSGVTGKVVFETSDFSEPFVSCEIAVLE